MKIGRHRGALDAEGKLWAVFLGALMASMAAGLVLIAMRTLHVI